jgi:hypothetical protein
LDTTRKKGIVMEDDDFDDRRYHSSDGYVYVLDQFMLERRAIWDGADLFERAGVSRDDLELAASYCWELAALAFATGDAYALAELITEARRASP